MSEQKESSFVNKLNVKYIKLDLKWVERWAV